MHRSKYIPFALSLALLAVGACAKKEQPAPAPAPEPEPMAAAAPASVDVELAGRADSGVSGRVTFTEADGGVAIAAHVEGVAPGSHGFHIHEIGDCSSEDFKSAGGHFNPTDAPHGAPTDSVHHAGDLGNIEVGEDGSGHLDITSDMLTFDDGPNGVFGRAVILHEGMDDLESQPTGAAGARLACGVVGGDEEMEMMEDEDGGGA